MKNARKIFSGGNLADFEEQQLFGATLPAAKMADEMGMPNSVRFLNQFDGTSWHSVDPESIKIAYYYRSKLSNVRLLSDDGSFWNDAGRS